MIALLQGAEGVDHDDVPRAFPVHLAGDQSYRAGGIAASRLGQGRRPVIPSQVSADRTARGVEFDRDASRPRKVLERLLGGRKESRRIVSRFDKTAADFAGLLKRALMHRSLRLMGI